MSVLSRYKGEAILVASCLAYSFEWYFVRASHAAGYTSWELGATRMILAAFISLAVVLIRGKGPDMLRLGQADVRTMVMRGVLAAVIVVCMNEALVRTSVVNVLILSYSNIFWGILLGTVLFSEPVGARKFIGSALAFIGVALVLVPIGELVPRFGAGEAIASGIALLYALGMVLIKKTGKVDFFTRLFVIFASAAVALLGSIFLQDGFAGFARLLDPSLLVYAGAMAITCSILGAGLMDIGTRLTPISVAMVVVLLDPVFQMITAAVFAHEYPTPVNLAGIALVLTMVAVVSWKPTNKEILSTEASV